MMQMSAEEALEAYEAARHRLPSIAPIDARPHRVARLADIADRFHIFLLDAFGVLNVGEAAIPGATESVADLQAAGKRVLIVSNAASVGKDALMEKYARLGFDFAPEDVVTSRQALAAKMDKSRDIHWGVVASDEADLSDLGLSQTEILADDPAVYERCKGILLIGSGEWTEARQLLLESALQHERKPVLVANPDIVAPRESGFSVEPGSIAHRLADLTGIQPEFYGKPFANIFDLVFERLGKVDPKHVVMVGDSLHTDILGARAYGIASALIPGFGFFINSDAEHAMDRTRIVPDFIVNRP